jgi:hypothetical protein
MAVDILSTVQITIPVHMKRNICVWPGQAGQIILFNGDMEQTTFCKQLVPRVVDGQLITDIFVCPHTMQSLCDSRRSLCL